jgi:hypothetical protein
MVPLERVWTATHSATTYSVRRRRATGLLSMQQDIQIMYYDSIILAALLTRPRLLNASHHMTVCN